VKDRRLAPARRAHALTDALAFALTHGITATSDDSGSGPVAGSRRPQVTVTVAWDMVHDALGPAVIDDTGTTLSPGAARRLLCDAEIIPAVLGSQSEVLDLGRSARLFPGCDRKPGWCDAHHVRWWDRDLGRTSYNNGVLLCTYHHSEIHRGAWTIAFADDGVPEFIPPTWIDAEQRPRRNTLHQHRAVA
jgi:hypothetical protein